MKKTNENLPYKTGEGSYNRQSGKKTLLFVGICISLVICLTIVIFLLLFNDKSL